MKKTEEFIEKYKHLEALIRTNYNLKNDISLITFFNSNSIFKPYLEKMRYIQDVRNLLQHKYKIGDEYPFEVADSLIKELDKMLETFSIRKRCKDIMLPYEKVYTASLDDKLYKTILHLKDKMYNHVPILQNNSLIGVFDEISLYELYINGIKLNEETSFKDIRRYIDLFYRKREKFIFFDENDYIDNLILEFDKAYQEGKRIGLVFLNSSGKIDNHFNGIISTSDIIGKIL